MKFQNVYLEALGYTIPREKWTSSEIEHRLIPIYERLKLPTGRLELMTGIGERRFWPVGTRPSTLSVASCHNAIEAAGIDRSKIGLLIHGSVCRDFLEPATACTVHHQVGLPADCVIYDVSNACLGILNGVLQAANMIELRQVEAALVVGSEGGRQLVETTIDSLNTDCRWNRKTIKDAIASLTIGSASCAILLTNESLSKTGNRLVGGAVRAHTQFNALCQSDHDQAGANFQPLMSTDSNELLVQGVQTGVATFDKFLQNTNWNRGDIDHTVCHQVGIAHQKLMLKSLELPAEKDFVTYPWLGNTGAAALPISLAFAAKEGCLQPDRKVALLGIGSGINSIMLGVNWKKSLVAGGEFA
jgi:acyl-CoA:acyl-CoA alkyltransferase